MRSAFAYTYKILSNNFTALHLKPGFFGSKGSLVQIQSRRPNLCSSDGPLRITVHKGSFSLWFTLIQYGSSRFNEVRASEVHGRIDFAFLILSVQSENTLAKRPINLWPRAEGSKTPAGSKREAGESPAGHAIFFARILAQKSQRNLPCEDKRWHAVGVARHKQPSSKEKPMPEKIGLLIDEALTLAITSPDSREAEIVTMKLQEALMWWKWGEMKRDLGPAMTGSSLKIMNGEISSARPS